MTELSVAPRVNEHPAPEAPLEWWYANGCYEIPPVGRRHFMVACFRSVGDASGADRGAQHQLLLCGLEEKTGRYRSKTTINPTLLWADSPHEGSLNADGRVLRILAEWSRTGILAEPLRLSEGVVRWASSPLDIAWDDFALRGHDGGFSLDFEDSIDGARCSFTLAADGSSVAVGASGREDPGASGMHYLSWPRLRLSGTMGKAAVDGEAWIDHQWGGYSWLVSNGPENRLRGWEWLGINLDDGTDWIVVVHRDAQSGRVLTRYATESRPGGGRHTYRDVRVRTTRFWESPRTRIRYPVAWRVEVPSARARFDFTPLSNEQEAPVFGLMRAVWEGAGVVEGTVAGVAVHGRAVGEVHGRGYIFDLDALLKRMGERVDRHIAELLPKTVDDQTIRQLVGPPAWRYEADAYSTVLSSPVWDLLGRGGKRWRPLFGLLLLEALEVDSSRYESLMAVLAELPHAGALILDDIEDDSALRRGAPSIHLIHGLDWAINAANTIYFLPMLRLADHPYLTDAQRLEIHQILVRQFVRGHLGQGLDLYWSRDMTPERLERWLDDDPRAKIMQMYALKTGCVVESVAEVAALLAGAGVEVRAACARFARDMAVAFQILDDVRGYGEPPVWGKDPGEDLVAGKPTFVVLCALERLEGARRARLMDLLCARDPTTLGEASALVTDSGSLEECRAMGRRMLRTAWEGFEPILRPCEARLLLQAMCENLVTVDLNA